MLTISTNQKQGIITGDILGLSLLREQFSIANPAYRSNKRFVASRVYAITPSGKFEIGLLENIIAFLQNQQIEYKIDHSIESIFNVGFKEPKIDNLNIEYRDYQKESIKKCLKKGRGVVVIPTAGGKTLIMAGLIKSLRSNLSDPHALSLVLVPSLQLVEQTANDFLSYGLSNVTKWSGNNNPDPTASIIVAGTQILLSEKTDLSILNEVKTLIVDETHGLRKGNEINKIFNLIKTHHKFGFTGTMPTSPIDQWNIIGKTGPIVFEQKTENLKQQNYVSNFKITILKIKHDKLPRLTVNSLTPASAYNQEIDYLINHYRRNEIIAKLALRLDKNTIIMVDRIDHGIQLEAILKNTCSEFKKDVYFIRGSTDIEEREQIRELMGNTNDVIVVAISKIFSTGINIPNLHNIIFASAGKAKIKIMQSIGRALRLHPTKILAHIFDIADNTKYGKIHVEERIKLYNSEKYNFEIKNI
jgi:superfamily II DNA or RNA helicase